MRNADPPDGMLGVLLSVTYVAFGNVAAPGTAIVPVHDGLAPASVEAA